MNTTATALALSTLAVARTEPPLKPNQPIQRMKVPSVASGRLAPGIGLHGAVGAVLALACAQQYHTPASAAAAPAMCTMPEPAKSEKPKIAQGVQAEYTALPPQVQEPSIG